MHNLRLAELTWIEVKEVTNRIPLAIIPCGAVEPYGPHLPLCTDGLIAEWLALTVAEKCEGIVTPLVAVGNSSLFSDFPGTISIDDTTFYEVIKGVGEGLRSAGFSELLIINGHAGNSAAISRYLKEAQQHFRVLLQIDVWRLVEALGQDLFTDVPGAFGHAGPAATSILLVIAPDLVRQERLRQCGLVLPHWLAGVYSPVSFRTLYPDGYVGDAGHASAEKGRVLCDRLINYIIQALRNARRLCTS